MAALRDHQASAGRSRWPADPNAPPLTPAYGYRGPAACFPRANRGTPTEWSVVTTTHTRDAWARILKYHRARGPRITAVPSASQRVRLPRHRVDWISGRQRDWWRAVPARRERSAVTAIQHPAGPATGCPGTGTLRTRGRAGPQRRPATPAAGRWVHGDHNQLALQGGAGAQAAAQAAPSSGRRCRSGSREAESRTETAAALPADPGREVKDRGWSGVEERSGRSSAAARPWRTWRSYPARVHKSKIATLPGVGPERIEMEIEHPGQADASKVLAGLNTAT